MNKNVCTSEITHNGQSKIDRYKWSIDDAPGDLLLINKNEIKIHPSYQRDASKPKLNQIAQNWSWIACGAIIVANRGGEYWAIDGQHRVLAAKKRSDIEKLPCIVFLTEDVAQEAKGFINANTLRKPISGFDRFKALIASKDKVAVKVNDVFEKYEIQPTRNANKGKQIKALSWAFNAAKADFVGFEKVIRVCSKLCQEHPLGVDIIDALFYINKNCIDIENKRFLDRILKIGPEKMNDGICRAKAYHTSGAPFVRAQGVINEVNKGLHKKLEFKKK